MASSGMLPRVALVRTDVSEESVGSIIRVTRIGEQGTTLAVTSNRRRLLVRPSVVHSSPILVTLMRQALRSSETSVLTRAKRHNISEDAILHSHRRENLKSYRALQVPEIIKQCLARRYSKGQNSANQLTWWVTTKFAATELMGRD
jgi:hypothetical protein